MSLYQDAYNAYCPEYARRHSDFIPILPIIVSSMMGILSSVFMGAMTESVKEHVVDPIVKRILNHAKSLIADRGKDETYTAAALRGIRKDLDKLSSILKREKAPIANKVKQLAGKVEKSEKKAEQQAKEAKKKKDSFFLADAPASAAQELYNAAIQDKGVAILGTLGGIIMWMATPMAVNSIKTLMAFIKDALKKMRFAPEKAMDFVAKIWEKIKAWIKSLPTNDLERSQYKRMKKTQAELKKQMKEFANATKKRAEAVAKEQKNAKAFGSTRKRELTLWGVRQGMKELQPTMKSFSSMTREEKLALLNQSQANKEEFLKRMKRQSKPTKATGKVGRPPKKKDALDQMIKAFLDSRLKRSQKRPGRATAWEIKTVLGIPEGMPLPKEYIGSVDGRGNVTVVNRMKPNQSPQTMSGFELDRRALESKGSGQFGTGGAINAIYGAAMRNPVPIGTYQNPISERFEKENQSKIKASIPKILQILALASIVASSVGSVTSGAAATITGVSRATSAIREGINNFKTAKADLTAAKMAA